MSTDYEFCNNPEELYKNVLQFHTTKELQRAALGNKPLYFIHVSLDDESAFSLSKFTAMRNITLESYVMGERLKTDGGTTQKHISRLLGKKWLPYKEVHDEIKNAFSTWIHSIFPKYNVHKASFITIHKETKWPTLSSKKNAISPERLIDQLRLQTAMGVVGERIAYLYEYERLSNIGADAKSCIDHVALYNTSAGYDISSVYLKNRRFIEVKASFTNDSPFYITSNEYEKLEKYGADSFIYRVMIEDLDRGKGKVSQIIQDPIRVIKNSGNIVPVLYKVSLF
jgi:hypothetical protein